MRSMDLLELLPAAVSFPGVPSPLLSPSDSSWRPLPGALGAEGCPGAPGAGMLPAPHPSQPGAGIHPRDTPPCSLPHRNPRTAWNGRTGLSTNPQIPILPLQEDAGSLPPFPSLPSPKIHPGDSHPPHLLATAASPSIALANFPAFSPKVGKAGQIPSSRCRARRRWQSSTAMGQRIPWIALFSVESPSSEREKGSVLSCLEKGKTPGVNWDPVWNSSRFPSELG